MHMGQMAGSAGVRSAKFLGAWLLLLGRGVGASQDIDLLMRAPFAKDLNWTDADRVCKADTVVLDPKQTGYQMGCDKDNNVITMSLW